MEKPMGHTIVLERVCSQRTNDEILRKQINFIVGRALGGSRGSSWTHKLSKIKATQIEQGWKFTSNLTFTKTGGRKDSAVERKQWFEILRFTVLASNNAKFGEYKWTLVKGSEELNGEEPIFEDKIIATDIKDYGNINLSPNNCFGHIYDRDHQIAIVRSAIIAAVESDFVNRFHCVLFGPPGCGKTEILMSIGRMLGQENEAFMKFDATSTTEAGSSRILLESDYIPPVLIVEEIEKTDEKSLRWMLGILDQRAEIRRTNFRIGNKARNVKMLCLATVNDMGLFEKVMSGALASRFAHEIYCPRPDRDVLKLILQREVKKVKGNEEWIEPSLEFCYDTYQIDDPRKIIPICLCGRENLLDGTYQKAIEATRRDVPVKRT
jgi:energy-coupling factor transporter ATP-binding protein EcfA2